MNAPILPGRAISPSAAVVEEISEHAAAALLCVERDPEACHRSLIAERLKARHGVDVVHLAPG